MRNLPTDTPRIASHNFVTVCLTNDVTEKAETWVSAGYFIELKPKRSLPPKAAEALSCIDDDYHAVPVLTSCVCSRILLINR